MVVSNDICKQCNKICFTIYFQQNFGNWTSGNDDIDKFIRDSQLSAHFQPDLEKALEWIPYDRFYDIKYIADEEFGKVYSANWIDECIDYWSDWANNWARDQHTFVILKNLNDPKIVTSEFINKVKLFYYLVKFRNFNLIYIIMFVDCSTSENLWNNSRSRN
jgi:hypothetical protein